MYEIRRFFSDPDTPHEVIKEGLTLEEAQEHCNDPETSNVEEGWFDGYTEVNDE
jgi:hypothetical protein